MVKKVFLRCLVFFSSLFLIEATFASNYSLPRLEGITSAVLMSANSGQILFEQNAYHRVNPGDLIQLMTLELAIEDLDRGVVSLETMIELSKDTQDVKGRRVFSHSGEKVKFYHLLESVAIISADDACIAIANHLGGSRNGFVELMNEKAKELGLSSTLIGDSCGCIEDTNQQYTTAHDMLQLAYYHIKRHPELLTLYSKSHFSFKGTHYRNKNYLLEYDNEYVDGLKGTQINERTYHLVATGSWDEARYIAIIVGAKTRKMAAYYALKLLYQGFAFFENVRLFEKGEEIAEYKVWKGESDYISLIPMHRVIVTVPKGKAQEISLNKIIPNLITAPIKKNEKLGKLDIVLREDVIKSIDLFPSQKMEQAHLFKRMWHNLLLKFKQ